MRKIISILIFILIINMAYSKQLQSYEVISKGKILARSFNSDKKRIFNDILLFSPIFLMDHKIKDRVDSDDQSLDFIEPFGDKKYLGIFAIGCYAFSFTDVSKDYVKFSEDLLYSFLYTGGVVALSKAVINRTNPAGVSGNDFKTRIDSSFISGHAALSFTTAATIANNTENRYIKYGAYTVSTLVCLQRVQSNSHFLSDVVYGAYFGYKISKYICSKEDYDILYMSKVQDTLFINKNIKF